jgi:hypothetical protein
MVAKETFASGMRTLIAILLVILVLELRPMPEARGQAAAGEDSGWLMATGDLAGAGSVCFLFDTKNMRLGAYTLKGRQFELTAMRKCDFDYRLVQFPGDQKPSVQDIKNLVEKNAKP